MSLLNLDACDVAYKRLPDIVLPIKCYLVLDVQEWGHGMAMTRGQHLIGKVFGSCVLERLLGQGGSSAVFLAQRQDDAPFVSERKVAVKVFLPRDDRMRITFYQRFLHEVKAVSKLEHANILPIYAYGEQEGLPYIVMPYMPGGTLSAYMARRGPLSLHEASWYLRQLASALDYAHQQGCVHCDVKPANVLLDRAGYAMLTDFGIAQLMRDQEDAERRSQRTKKTRYQESIVGTPEYVSPEQVQMHAIDGRSDVYSLGVLLFYVLTLQLPFQSDTMITLALLHVYEPPPSLMALRADITPAVERVVLKALAKRPEDRYQTAGEFSAAFADAIAHGEKRRAMMHMSRTEESGTPLQQSYVALSGHDDSVARPALNLQRSRPPRRSPSTLPRFISVAVALCCILASICFFAFSMVVSHSQGSSHPLAVTPLGRQISTPTPAGPFASWPQGSGFFVDSEQRYHIVNSQTSGAALAFDKKHLVEDFQASVTIQEIRISGLPDYQGIVFRISTDTEHYYMFSIAPQDRTYEFVRYDNDKFHYLSTGTLPFVLHAKNTLTINAQGNAFQFSVDGHAVTQEPLHDSEAPLRSGLFGFYLENEGEVAFSQLSLRLH